jgi:hypothetical protein
MRAVCARCGVELPPSRGPRARRWCSETCRRLGPLPALDAPVASLEEVLRLLSARARAGSVAAMGALLRYFERNRRLAEDRNPDDRFALLDAIRGDRDA